MTNIVNNNQTGPGFGNEITVSSGGGIMPGMGSTLANPSVTQLANGNFMAVWQNSGSMIMSGSSIRVKVYDQYGTQVGTESTVASNGSNMMTTVSNPVVSALPDGRAIVAYQTTGDIIFPSAIAYRILDAGGASGTSEVRLPSLPGMSIGAFSVDILSDGNFALAWVTSDMMMTQSISPVTGMPVGPAMSVPMMGGAQSVSLTGTANGTIALAWHDGAEIWLGVKNNDYPNQAPVDVFIPVGWTDLGNSFEGTHPQVTALNNGNLVITWSNQNTTSGAGNGDVFFRVYSANGNALTEVTRANMMTDGVQQDPQVSAMSDGGFVLAWQSSGVNAPIDIMGRRFDAQGQAADSIEFAVSAGGTEKTPAVTALAGGQFATVWVDTIAGTQIEARVSMMPAPDMTTDSGYSAIDNVTNAGVLEFNGTAEARHEGAEVKLFLDANGNRTHDAGEMYAVTSVSNGTWSTSLTAGEGEGRYDAYAVIGSPSTGISTSAPLSVTLDRTAPAAIVSELWFGSTTGSPAGSSSVLYTNQLAPTIGGTVSTLTGDLVEVSVDNGITWMPAAVTPLANTWSLPPTALSPAGGIVQARVTDAAGNHGTVQEFAYQVDMTPPSAVIVPGAVSLEGSYTHAITVVYDDLAGAGLDTTSLSRANIQVAKPGGIPLLVTGITTNGNSVTYHVMPVDGIWNTEDAGDYEVTLVSGSVRDLAGNAITQASGATLTVQFNAGPEFSQTAVQPPVIQNGAPVDITQLFSVSDLDLNQTITWSVQNPGIGTLSYGQLQAASGSASIVPGTPVWYQPPPGFAGIDSFTVSASDGTETTWHHVEVRVAPAAPGTPDLSAASDSGLDAQDNVTAARSVTFTGTSAANDSTSTVRVFIDADGNGRFDPSIDASSTATVENGSWTVSNIDTSALQGGAYNAYAFTESVGTASVGILFAGGQQSVTSELSAPLGITIDRTGPATEINGITLSADTGASATDFVTKQASQVVSATLSAPLAAGETLYGSFDGGQTWSNLSASVSGTVLAATVELAGSGTIVFKIHDEHGNAGTGYARNYWLDQESPATTSLAPAFSSDSGVSAHDRVTNVAQQSLSGQLSQPSSAGDIVEVSLDNGHTWLRAVHTSGSADWSLQGVSLSGSGALQVRVSDAAGNAGPVVHQQYLIDTDAPTASATAADLASPTASTFAVTVTYTDGELPIDPASINVGNITVAGPQGQQLTVVGVTFVPVVTTPTTVTTVTTLTAPAAIGMAVTYQVQAPNGSWDRDEAGTYTVTMGAEQVRDIAGNAVAPVALASFDVAFNDIPAFIGHQSELTLVQNGGAADVAHLLHVGDSDAGQTIEWSAEHQPMYGTLSFGQTGTASGGGDIAPGGSVLYTPAPGFAGSDVFTVKVSDGADVSYRTIYVNVGLVTPGAPDLAAASDSGLSDSDNVTGANSVSFSGTSAEGDTSSTVNVFIDSNRNGSYDAGIDAVASATVNNGSWTVDDISTAGLDGAYNAYAFTTGGQTTVGVASIGTVGTVGTVTTLGGLPQHGIESALSAPVAIVIDHAGPATQISDMRLSADTGISDNDFVTKEATQTISATLSAPLAAGETLYGSFDGGQTWSNLNASVSGTQLAATVTLATSGMLILKIHDEHGNAGTGYARNYWLDQESPATTSLAPAFSSDSGVSAHDRVTNVAQQSLSGQLSQPSSAGDIVEVSLDNGHTWLHAVHTSGNADWSLQGVSLSGSGALQVRVSDAAGNAGPVVHQQYLIDTEAPTASATAADLASPTNSTFAVTVTYTDGELPVDPGSINVGNITVAGPQGQQLTVVGVTFVPVVSTPTTVTTVTTLTAPAAIGMAVTYQVQAPNGSWDRDEAGTYTVTMGAGQVRDIAGNAVAPVALASFDVAFNDIPAFIGHQSELTLVQNGGATDVAHLLHVGDSDAGQTIEWSAEQQPMYGTLSFGQTGTASGGGDIAPAGSVLYTPAPGFAGSDVFTVKVSDGADVSYRTIYVNVGLATPGAPDLAAASDSGLSDSDNVTGANSVSFSGTSAEGDTSSTVNVFIDSNRNGSYDAGIDAAASATVNNGSWTVDGISTAGLDGAYNAYAFTSGVHGTAISTISTVNPVNTINPINPVNTINPIGIIPVSGAQSALSAPISITIDHVAPATTVSSLALSNDTGTSGTDLVTSRADQVVSATLSAPLAAGETLWGSTDGGRNWADISTSVNGTSLSLPAQLQGNDWIMLSVHDEHGNASAPQSWAFNIDQAAPLATSSAPQLQGDSGASATDLVTNVAAQVISGRLDAVLAAGEMVEVSLDNGASWSIADASSGSTGWSLAAQLPASGAMQVRVKDAAGNLGQAISHDYLVDTAAPQATVSAADLFDPTGASFSFSVSYADVGGAGVDPASFGTGNVSVLYGSTTALPVTGYAVNGNTVTYTVAAPGGDWDRGDAGVFTVAINPESVRDVAGNPVAQQPAAASFAVTFNAAPVLGGASSQAAIADTATASPFAGATLSDRENDPVSVRISYNGANGVLSGAGLTSVELSGTPGNYVLTAASAALVEARLQSLVFTPTVNLANGGQSATTTFTLTPTDGITEGQQFSAVVVSNPVLPAATIVLGDSHLLAGESTQVSITFSEQVSHFGLEDLVVPNGTLSNLASSDGVHWTATLTPDAERIATTQVTLNHLGYTDLGGAHGQPGASAEVSINTVRPTAEITLSDSALLAGESSTVTITFSEAVTGLTRDDLQFASGTLGEPVSADGGRTWTAVFTPDVQLTDTSNIVTLANSGVTNAAGNSGVGNAQSANYTVQTVRPDAAITISDTVLTPGETAAVTVTFSEAVTGFHKTDLAVTGGTMGDVSSADGGVTWTATFTPTAEISASGSVSLDKAGVQNAVGNAGQDAVSAPSFVVSTRTPTKVDGVTVQTGEVTNASGGTDSVVNVPVITTNRADDPNTPNATLADIPLGITNTDGPSVGLTVSLPNGTGLQATGPATLLSNADALADLINRIEVKTPTGSTVQQQMTGQGTDFLGNLGSNVMLQTKTLVPTVAAGSSPSQAIVINGSSASQPGGANETAIGLVIDATNLPSNVVMNLNNVDFAAIVGSATLRGGEGRNYVVGDGAEQSIFLGADDDILAGGGGNDKVGSAGGDDTLDGGDGDDIVVGGIGNDTLRGGAGNDILQGGRSATGDWKFFVDASGNLGARHELAVFGPGTTEAVAIGELDLAQAALGFTGATSARLVDLSLVYHAMLGRAPDLAGINFWANSDASALDMAKLIVADSEWEAGGNNALSNTAFVEKVYEQALGRASDAAGKAFWAAKLDAGVTRVEMLTSLAFSNEFRALKSDADGLTIGTGELGVESAWFNAGGVDTVVYDGKAADYKFVLDNNGTVKVEHIASGDVDTLSGIEAGRFGAETVDLAFTQSDQLGTLGMLYQSVLNRAGDLAGFTWWLGQDLGSKELVTSFMQSDEVVAALDGMSDAQFVAALYANAGLSETAAGGMQGWQDYLGSHTRAELIGAWVEDGAVTGAQFAGTGLWLV